MTSHNPLPEELTGLQDLVKLAGQGNLAFIAPLPNAQKELEAALWVRLGEAYRGKQEDQAIYWHQKALGQLLQETRQSEEEIRSLLNADIQEKKYDLQETNGSYQEDDSIVSTLQRRSAPPMTRTTSRE